MQDSPVNNPFNSPEPPFPRLRRQRLALERFLAWVTSRSSNLLRIFGASNSRTWESWAQYRRDETEHRRVVEREHGFQPNNHHARPPGGVALVAATLLVCVTAIVIAVAFSPVTASLLEMYKEIRTGVQ